MLKYSVIVKFTKVDNFRTFVIALSLVTLCGFLVFIFLPTLSISAQVTSTYACLASCKCNCKVHYFNAYNYFRYLCTSNA